MRESKVELSIVTVVLNDLSRLETTIKSVERLKSVCDLVEHVIIDGGSTDGSVQRIEKYATTGRVRFLSEADLGIYDAMNKALGICSGEYIWFLNSGDQALCWGEQLLEILERSSRSISAYCFPFLAKTRHRIQVKTPIESCLYRLPTSHQAMIFRSSFLRQQPYSLKYSIASDYHQFLTNSIQYHNCHFDIPIVLVGQGGISESNPHRSYGEYIRIAWDNLRGWTKVWIGLLIAGRFFARWMLKNISRIVIPGER